MHISNRSLINVDRFCDYIPVVSSLTNLYGLFLKFAIFPLRDKDRMEANRYYKYLDQKSSVRCLLLVIPIVGNILIGLYDFSNRKPNEKAEKIRFPVRLKDIKKIEIEAPCGESSPCQHRSKVFLRDGRQFGIGTAPEISYLVFRIAKRKINPSHKWNAERVRNHFRKYNMLGTKSSKFVLS